MDLATCESCYFRNCNKSTIVCSAWNTQRTNDKTCDLYLYENDRLLKSYKKEAQREFLNYHKTCASSFKDSNEQRTKNALRHNELFKNYSHLWS